MKDIFLKKFIKFKYLKYDNNKILEFNLINNFIKNNYGFNILFYNFLKIRFEILNKNNIFNSKNRYILYKTFRFFLTRFYSFYNIFEWNLINLYYLNNYRCWRHMRGLPTRGQRTWSNSSTPFYNNVNLRKIIYKKALYEYTGADSSLSNLAFLAEFANKIWKIQWFTEWSIMRKKRLQFKNAYSSYKVDLYSMSQFNIKIEKEKKVLSKRARRKKKVEIRNIFTTGFDEGFTRSYLQKSNVGLRTNKVQLITGKMVNKIKKKAVKKKAVKKKAVKKKKSVWD